MERGKGKRNPESAWEVRGWWKWWNAIEQERTEVYSRCSSSLQQLLTSPVGEVRSWEVYTRHNKINVY